MLLLIAGSQLAQRRTGGAASGEAHPKKAGAGGCGGAGEEVGPGAPTCRARVSCYVSLQVRVEESDSGQRFAYQDLEVV